MKYTAKNHTFAICAHGESEYLEDCIRSLKAQTEVSRIILYAARTNPFLETIAAKYELPLYIRGGDPEISTDWNFALRTADTELVTLAHQDDIYEPAFLKKTLVMLGRERHPLISFTDYYEIRDGKKEDPDRSPALRIKKKMLFPLRLPGMKTSRMCRRLILSFGCPVCCPSVTYVKANLPKKIFSKGLKVALDWQAWERLSRRQGSFCYIPGAYMGHRIHALSETSKALGKSGIREREDLWMFRKFWPEGIAAVLNRLYGAGR